MGLRLSAAKTRIVHMSEGFDFLGFRIQWRRKRGTSKWYVYTFIADRPIRSVKDKIRALTHRTSQQPPRDVLIRLNQIMRGWANYFRHAVCKHTLNSLENFVWHRVIRWWMRLHRWTWRDVRRHLTGPNGRWSRPSADGIELFNIASVRSPGTATAAARSPTPGPAQPRLNGRDRGEPAAGRPARRVRRAAWGNGPGAIPAPRPRPTQPLARLLSAVSLGRAVSCWKVASPRRSAATLTNCAAPARGWSPLQRIFIARGGWLP